MSSAQSKTLECMRKVLMSVMTDYSNEQLNIK